MPGLPDRGSGRHRLFRAAVGIVSDRDAVPDGDPLRRDAVTEEDGVCADVAGIDAERRGEVDKGAASTRLVDEEQRHVLIPVTIEIALDRIAENVCLDLCG